MKKAKIIGILLLVVMMISLVAGCGEKATTTPTPSGTATATATPSGKVYEMKNGNFDPPNNAFNSVGWPYWGKWLERESNGRIKMTLLTSSAAAAPPDLYDAAKNGIVEVSVSTPMFTPGRWPLNDMFALPFLYTWPSSYSAARSMWAIAKKYPAFMDEYSDTHLLGFYSNGIGHVHTTKKPIRKLEDFKGVILSASGKVGVGMTSALGATPETVSPSEGYDALAKGVVEGNIQEWEGNWVWHYYELTNYSTDVGMSCIEFVATMNKDAYNNLPADLKPLFEEKNNQNLMGILGYVFDLDDKVDRQRIADKYKAKGQEDIYVLPEAERQRWIAAVEPVIKDWKDEAAKKGLNGQEVIDACKAFDKQYKAEDKTWAPKMLKDWGVPQVWNDYKLYE